MKYFPPWTAFVQVPVRGLALMNRKPNSLNAVRILSPSDLAMLTPAQIPVNSQQPAVISTAIRPRICICCGEPMVERGNALSRNPNICASCSSLADGAEAHLEQTTQDDDSQIGISVPIHYQPECDRRFV